VMAREEDVGSALETLVEFLGERLT
jgi:hypothetical protein